MATKFKVRIPIGFKLIAMQSLMLMGSITMVVYLATDLFTQDNTAFIQQQTSDSARQLADQTHEYFDRLVHVLTTITEIENQKSEAQREAAIRHQYERNGDLVSVATWRKDASRAEHMSLRQGKEAYKTFASDLRPSSKVWEGDLDIQRVSFKGEGLLALSVPLAVDANKKVVSAVVGLVNQLKIVSMYGKKGAGFTYLVDRDGNVLGHPKEYLMASGASLKDVPIVKEMMERKKNNSQTRFVDTDGLPYLGAFRLVGVADTGVISQVPEEVAFRSVRQVRYRSVMFAGAILFLAFGIAYFFSKTLTKPIRALVELTREIASGNFGIQVKPKGHDEITELTKSFGQMATGLAERDKLKETFNKFHSKEIAEAILKGEVKLGGSRQQATVFFSDIRSFTSISEELEAEQVVEMLNEYMTAMVSEITAHHGVVDKYVGDAIMAVWGVPMSKPGDTWNAVRASIAMRSRLAKFNEERIKKGKKPVMIGMGLHTGELIAGNIGSTEKMEYTVIGDTVNTASRIESLTKEFGTDMLISDEVYAQVKDKVIAEPVSAQVKGKSKALTAYKVKGYYDEAGKPVIVETPYSTYEAGHSDKVVHTAKKSA